MMKRTGLVALGLSIAAFSPSWAQDLRLPLEGFITDDHDLPVDGSGSRAPAL